MSSFDPTALLATPITKEASQGRKALLPEGSYSKCVIKEITPWEPSDDQKAKGVQVRVQLRIETPDYAEPINGYVNVKDPANPHPKSVQFQLFNAIWPNEKERENKTLNDLVGEVVNIMVVHQSNQNGDPYAALNYRPIK
tara:strand:- start:384 stop:803 length:420 start_codon:yes stop_codon:yes gene_type:complete